MLNYVQFQTNLLHSKGNKVFQEKVIKENGHLY